MKIVDFVSMGFKNLWRRKLRTILTAVGVAIGTVLATLFRLAFYVSFLSRHILQRGVFIWIKRMAINSCLFIFFYIIGSEVVSKVSIDNYLDWIIISLIVSLIVGIVTFITNLALYRDDMLEIIHKGFGKMSFKNKKE